MRGGEPSLERKKELLVPIERIIPGINKESLVTNNGIQNDDHEVEDGTQDIPRSDPEYERKIRGVAQWASHADHLADELQESPEARSHLAGLKGQVLVDLGAGSYGGAYPIAPMLGAAAYVGVDKYFAYGLRENIKIEQAANPLPSAVVREDLLSFLRRLPDGSVSIICSALTKRHIVSDPEYIRQVDAEIARVLHPQGVYVNYMDAAFKPRGLLRQEVTELDLQDLKIFSKQPHTQA